VRGYALLLIPGLLLALGCRGSPPAQVEIKLENPAERERALAEVQRLGGRFEVDENDPAKPVVLVDLSGAPATDASLTCLGGLPNLRRLYLGATNVTDAGLVHLKGLTELRILALDGTKVTDAGVQDLKQVLPKAEFVR
jgi:hypothetical protein